MKPSCEGASRTTLDPKLRDLYRAATPTQKLAVVGRINAALIALKEADLVGRFPNLSTAERRTHVRRWWRTARD